MAIKYVDPTAAYDGDGTLSTPASGAGQPGAWNNLVGVFTNNSTYPVADGDTVIVRTADASGNPITVNATSTLTMAARGSLASPVQWVFDAGVVWAAGVLTLSISSTVVFTFAACNWFDCDGDNLRLRLLHNQAGRSSLTNGVMFAQGVYSGIEVTTVNIATLAVNFTIGFGTSGWKETRLVKCKFDMSLCSTTGGNFGNFSGLQYSTIFFDDCTFDFSRAPAVPSYLFTGVSASYGVIVQFRGGRVVGCSDTTALIYYSTRPTSFYNIRYYANGFHIGDMEIMRFESGVPERFGDLSELVFNNLDGLIGQFLRITLQGTVDWYPGKNYPTLNAILPDGSNTPWSIRVQPRTANVSLSYPLSISAMSKFYDLAPATKTITVELLLSEQFATMSKKDWWVDVFYVDDTTGLTKNLSSFALSGDLDVSAAEWTTTFYGAKNYIKRKISVQTPTAIKQYSDITVVLRSALPAPSTTDFYFVCPDFKVE